VVESEPEEGGGGSCTPMSGGLTSSTWSRLVRSMVSVAMASVRSVVRYVVRCVVLYAVVPWVAVVAVVRRGILVVDVIRRHGELLIVVISREDAVMYRGCDTEQ